MKYIEIFKTREAASEKKQLLAARGIKAKILVDPLEARYPALSAFHDVALVVGEEVPLEVTRLLQPAYAKAS